MSKIKVTQKNLKNLESVFPKMRQFTHKIEHMNNDVKAEFELMRSAVETLFSKHWENEKKESDARYEYFSTIQDENDFSSVWAMDEVKDMNAHFGFVKELFYRVTSKQKVSVEINKDITWLEFWKFADQLVKESGEIDHIFIEGFAQDLDDTKVYELILGS